MPGSASASSTSGCVCRALPAERASCRPSAALPRSRSYITERPLFATQTKSTAARAHVAADEQEHRHFQLRERQTISARGPSAQRLHRAAGGGDDVLDDCEAEPVPRDEPGRCPRGRTARTGDRGQAHRPRRRRRRPQARGSRPCSRRRSGTCSPGPRSAIRFARRFSTTTRSMRGRRGSSTSSPPVAKCHLRSARRGLRTRRRPPGARAARA